MKELEVLRLELVEDLARCKEVLVSGVKDWPAYTEMRGRCFVASRMVERIDELTRHQEDEE